MKARPERLGLKLEALRKTVPGLGFFYYEPPVYPMDIDEIQPADIEMLIARLRSAGIYDRIVIDTSNGLSLRNKTLMELADHIFIVAKATAAGQKKLAVLKGQIDKCFADQAVELYKRVHVFLNGVRVAGNAGGRRRTSAAVPSSDDGAGADCATIVNELTSMFSAKVSILPYSEAIGDDCDPQLLSGISHGFGAAIAEIAHRV